MWNFIWHLQGSAAAPEGLPNEALLDRVERLLSDQQKPVTYKTSSEIRFDAPLWKHFYRGPSWLAMALYDRGSFEVEEGIPGKRIRYNLRSLHALIFCLLGAIAFYFFVVMNGGPSRDGITIAVLGFVWLYGVNLALAWIRVPRAIRKATVGG